MCVSLSELLIGFHVCANRTKNVFGGFDPVSEMIDIFCFAKLRVVLGSQTKEKNIRFVVSSIVEVFCFERVYFASLAHSIVLGVINHLPSGLLMPVVTKYLCKFSFSGHSKQRFCYLTQTEQEKIAQFKVAPV
jgi:hypothetical protein